MTSEKISKRLIGLHLSFSSRSISTIVAAIIFFNLALLTATALYFYFVRIPEFWDQHPIMSIFIRYLNLAFEDNLATWYSATVILLVSLAASLCFIVDRKQFQCGRDRFFTYGWLLIAVVFLGLSFDEMGAFHERLGAMDINVIKDWDSGWVSRLAIPIAVVGGLFLIFTWTHLSRNRWSLLFMTLGTLLYLSIPVLEWLEFAFRNEAEISSDAHRSILQVIAEEGGELFGSLCFLSAMLLYLQAASQRNSELSRRPYLIDFVNEPRVIILGAGVLLSLFELGMVGVWFALKYLPPQKGGAPLDWFPSTLAILATIVCVQIWSILRDKNKLHACGYMILAGYNVLLSTYYGSDLGSWILALDRSLLPFIMKSGFFVTTIILGFFLLIQSEQWWSRFGACAWAALLGLRFIGFGWIPLDLLGLAFLSISLLGHLQKWQAPQEFEFPALLFDAKSSR